MYSSTLQLHIHFNWCDIMCSIKNGSFLTAANGNAGSVAQLQITVFDNHFVPSTGSCDELPD